MTSKILYCKSKMQNLIENSFIRNKDMCNVAIVNDYCTVYIYINPLYIIFYYYTNYFPSKKITSNS